MTAPVLAIAGAFGRLGRHVTRAALAGEYTERWSRIILLSRDAGAAECADEFTQDARVEIRAWPAEGKLVTALEGVEVLINAVGTAKGAGLDFRARMLEALCDPSCSVNTYLPSEYGVDTSGETHGQPVWQSKRSHVQTLRERRPQLKVVKVFAGLILEDTIGPWCGFYPDKGYYEAVSSADALISFTAFSDLARSVVAAAALGEDAPEELHLAGDTKSVREIAVIMNMARARKAGESEIKVRVLEDGVEYKRRVIEEGGDLAEYLRFMMGEGKIDHRWFGQDNGVVNPGGSRWAWKTVEEYARETEGRPWEGFPWPPPAQ